MTTHDVLRRKRVAFYLLDGQRRRCHLYGFRTGRVVSVDARGGELRSVVVRLAGGEGPRGGRSERYNGPKVRVHARELRATCGPCGVIWRGRTWPIDEWLAARLPAC
jgi:hypothetical protein